MKQNLETARHLLTSGDYTLVLHNGKETVTSTERGVKPLLALYLAGKKYTGYSAADKVVGKAAAFLYVLLEVAEVYAPVMSEKAVSVLKSYGIPAACDVCPETIINRMGTGMCPMEQAVWEIETPDVAVKAIQIRLDELQTG